MKKVFNAVFVNAGLAVNAMRVDNRFATRTANARTRSAFSSTAAGGGDWGALVAASPLN